MVIFFRYRNNNTMVFIQNKVKQYIWKEQYIGFHSTIKTTTIVSIHLKTTTQWSSFKNKDTHNGFHAFGNKNKMVFIKTITIISIHLETTTQ